jgi:hypothetical protein
LTDASTTSNRVPTGVRLSNVLRMLAAERWSMQPGRKQTEAISNKNTPRRELIGHLMGS